MLDLPAMDIVRSASATELRDNRRCGRKGRVLYAASVWATALLLTGGSSPAAAAQDQLAAEFANPPQSVRPRLWWHWMNGNITEDGIQKDLEWMSRVGVGGLQNFDAALATPQIVPRRLVYMTPEWKDAFRFAVQTADRLGLEFAIAGSPGWSESGGPWVPPADAMKKLVWSETLVEGGLPFLGIIAQPPSSTGPYQTLPPPPDIASWGAKAETAPPPRAYGDVAVLAYRLPDAPSAAPAQVRTGDGAVVDAKALSDAAGPCVTVVGRPGTAPSLVFDYTKPQTIRSVTVFIPDRANMWFSANIVPELEAETADGWRKVADVELMPVPTTVSFAPVTAQRFRLVIRPREEKAATGSSSGAPGAVTVSPFTPPSPTEARISLAQLSSEARVNRFESKAGFATVRDYYALDARVGPDVAGVAPGAVIDLSSKLRADGRLEWNPPPGRWKVVRLGWSLVGTTNHPATGEATGLEVDEYDGAAVRRYIDTYLDMYAAITGPDLMGKHGLKAQVNDSTEVGPSNWTPSLLEQFQRLRGYDARPWLPALTGAIIGSRVQSDAFLYDFRRTLADLVASEHYRTIAEAVHARGMIAYGEALEGDRIVLGDDMAMRRYTDVPMSAMWSFTAATGPSPVAFADIKGAASVAHIYGQNLVAAESMTSANSPWAFAPSDLKRVVDLEFVTGVNRPVIHTSVHQPVDDKVPGLSLLVFGQYFNRHETWAEMARPWIDYISRSSYMLQQGRNVADVAYFYGEEAPLVAQYHEHPPTDAPTHYAYDYLNPDALLNDLSVRNHELVTPGGARYRALYLGGTSRRMTVRALRRLAELAQAGATIIGVAPEGSPSLEDDPAEFAALVQSLWGRGAMNLVGTGRVIASHDIESTLQAGGLVADFSVSAGAQNALLPFVHRKLADGDVYFLVNRDNHPVHLDARFRVSGKAPEIWRADNGLGTPASYRIEREQTVVPLDLAAEEAVFVVFRKPAEAAVRSVRQTHWTSIGEIGGSWSVTFQPGRGAPGATRVMRLRSLSESADPGIKYFSGTATYRTSFELPRAARPGAPLMLDLGQVGVIAQVAVNGQPLGYAWKAPFRVDIAKAARRGRNTIEVKVADLWVNRLIGDAQPGAKKITYTSLPTYRADAPLRPSGLIGPVTLLQPSVR